MIQLVATLIVAAMIGAIGITAAVTSRNRKHLPPEQPTGRVCVGCHNVIRRNDKWHLLAAKHDDCNFPQGSPLPPSLERLIEGEQ